MIQKCFYLIVCIFVVPGIYHNTSCVKEMSLPNALNLLVNTNIFEKYFSKAGIFAKLVKKSHVKVTSLIQHMLFIPITWSHS